MSFQFILIILMYAFTIVAVISIVFFKRDETGVTFAWLLVFIFLPYIGFILYFFAGSNLRMRIMSKRYGMKEIEDKYNEDIYNHIEKIEHDKIKFNEEETEIYRDLIILNAKNAMSYYTENNDIELLINGEEKFPRLFQDLENAKESIDILYFIFKSKDKVGKKLISLLVAKAKEGVKVKLIYDSIGCLQTQMRDFNEIKKAGGEVYRFLPTMTSSFLHINYRMHRKMVIIDGKIAYTGGINVGDEYFCLKDANRPWRDTSIRLTGNSVLLLQRRFWADLVFIQNQTWRYRNKFKGFFEDKPTIDFLNQSSTGKAGIQIVSSGPSSNIEMIKDGYVKMINSAKKYLYIQSPYFVPDKTLINSLRIAASSGVDVRIMLPGIPDKKYVYYVTLSHVEEMLNVGIKVYLHKGFIHSKTLVIDDHVATVGTTNMDIRSFKLDYEVNAFVYNTEFATKCKDTFLADINDCKEVDIETFSKRIILNRFLESLCRLISPLA